MKVLILLIVSLLVGCSTENTGAEDVSSNLPPTVVLASSIEGLEGSVVELEGAVNDPENEALILEWTYPENAPTPISIDSTSASITLPRVTELTTFI